MDFNEYQKAATTTMSSPGSDVLVLAMLGMGVGGEAGEVLEILALHQPPSLGASEEKGARESRLAKLREEVGDILWYIGCLCETTGLSMQKLHQSISGSEPEDLNIQGMRMVAYSCAITDYLKKVVGHGHELDLARLENHIQIALFHIGGFCDLLGTDIFQVAEDNITKLKARYPAGFSTTKSAERYTD